MILKTTEPTARAILAASLPAALNLREVTIAVQPPGNMNLTSYWSGGTRDYHVILDLATMQTVPIPENGSGFTAVDRACGPAGLPLELPQPGLAVVTYTDGCYKSARITLHPDNAAKLLKPAEECSWTERVVLAATRSLKPGYGGVKNFRFVEANRETGITADQYEQAKASLTARKLLNSAGAITTDGKNVIGRKELYHLAKEAR